MHLAVFCQRGEQAIGLGFLCQGERQREALETRLAGAATVGRHDGVAADAKAGVHHLVLIDAGLAHGGIGAVLEVRHTLHFCAEGFAVEIEGFFAAPIKEQVRLNNCVVFCGSHNFFSQCLRFVSYLRRTKQDVQDNFYCGRARNEAARVFRPSSFRPCLVVGETVQHVGQLRLKVFKVLFGRRHPYCLLAGDGRLGSW